MIYTTRSIKNLKLLQITMEFQKELIVLQNQMPSFLRKNRNQTSVQIQNVLKLTLRKAKLRKLVNIFLGNLIVRSETYHR